MAESMGGDLETAAGPGRVLEEEKAHHAPTTGIEILVPVHDPEQRLRPIEDRANRAVVE